MLEAVKLVGAIAGLLTTAFVVWDRWARGRPLAWVTAKKFGASRYEYIRIQNPGPADVFVLAVRAYPSKVYGIAKDHSGRAIVEAASFEIDVNVLLGKDGTRDFPIVKVADPHQRPVADRKVCFVIYWRKTSSSYLPQFPVWIVTSTRHIERISAAATAELEVGEIMSGSEGAWRPR